VQRPGGIEFAGCWRSLEHNVSVVNQQEEMMPDEGRKPYRERPAEARQFPVGDQAPFKGEAPARPDEDIKRDVETALFYDDAVSSIGIDVRVSRGVVSLAGAVNSDLAKRLAGEDAWQVSGVRNVENNLTVQETPTKARAAGQGVIETKPPEANYGEPPPASQQRARQTGQGSAESGTTP
jgi:hypothetical protein